MKAVISLILCGMASAYAALVAATPPDTPPPDIRPYDFFPFNTTLNSTGSMLGYDPSTEYHGQATIEVWTGGSRRQPVNAGNVGGHALHQVVTQTLHRTCYSKYGMYCDDFSWKTFDTLYLKTPPAGIVYGVTYFRTNSAEWANDKIREIMFNIVGRVLYAYTTAPLGTNCYEVPGQGKFCNIPQFIRVHLPNSSPDKPKQSNYWNVEFFGQPSQFSDHGNLMPCHTRAAVDEQLDMYKDQLEGQFPDWKGRFSRDTRVIINGWKVCSDEP